MLKERWRKIASVHDEKSIVCESNDELCLDSFGSFDEIAAVSEEEIQAEMLV